MNLSPDKQREMLRQMLTIRCFEERASADYHAGKIYGVVHCYIGEDAVAVRVFSALERSDRIISTHRGHGHCIAKGADLNRMMAELFGRPTVYCQVKGRLMHLADFDHGLLGAGTRRHRQLARVAGARATGARARRALPGHARADARRRRGGHGGVSGALDRRLRSSR